MLLKAGIKPLPILQVIVSKLIYASESMDLLVKMDRLTGTQGMSHSYSFGLFVLIFWLEVVRSW
jgi:hypothetical protein